MSPEREELRELVRQTRHEVERLERSGRGSSAEPELAAWMQTNKPSVAARPAAAPGVTPTSRTATAKSVPPPSPSVPRYSLNAAPAPVVGDAGRTSKSLKRLDPPVNDPRDLPAMAAELSRIGAEAAVCRKCGLCETRTNVVFGSGTAHYPLMFVGEAPGFNEDQQGLPFVGQAGKLLTDIIAAMGFDRQDVYIANVLKCRPPENRDPLPHEIEACWPWLEQQIELLKPRVICTLGKYSAQLLTGSGPRATIGNMRGRVFHFKGIPVVPTYHPAFLLRSPSFKRATWDDVQLARELYLAAEAAGEEASLMTPADMSGSADATRVPPQALDAERMVLGAIMLEREAIGRALEILDSEAFYRGAHRRIYQCVLSLYDRGEAADVVTVANELNKRGWTEEAGGSAYLGKLVEEIGTSAHVEYHARIVLEKATLRRLIAAAGQIMGEAYDQRMPANDLLDKAEESIFAISEQRDKKAFVSLREMMKETFESIEEQAPGSRPSPGWRPASPTWTT